MSVAAVTMSGDDSPISGIIYGPEGVGKTTFVAQIPGVVLFRPERKGLERLKVPAFPVPQTFGDVIDAIESLTNDKHAYEAFAIDSLDWLYMLLTKSICAKNNWATIETPKYGKGYDAVGVAWKDMTDRLEVMMEKRRIAFWATAHADVKTIPNPGGDDFMAYELAMQKTSAKLWRQWPSVILFANWTEQIHKAARADTKGKLTSLGARILYTERTTAAFAKNRYNLPPTLPMSWEDFAKRYAAGGIATPEKLRKQISAVLPQLKPEDRAQIEQDIRVAGQDARRLAQILNRAGGMIATADADDEGDDGDEGDNADGNSNDNGGYGNGPPSEPPSAPRPPSQPTRPAQQRQAEAPRVETPARAAGAASTANVPSVDGRPPLFDTPPNEAIAPRAALPGAIGADEGPAVVEVFSTRIAVAVSVGAVDTILREAHAIAGLDEQHRSEIQRRAVRRMLKVATTPEEMNGIVSKTAKSTFASDEWHAESKHLFGERYREIRAGASVSATAAA
jgi:hypothetical protein